MNRILPILLLCCFQALGAVGTVMWNTTNGAIVAPTNIASITIGGATINTNLLLTTVQSLTPAQRIVHRQNTGNAGIEDVPGFPPIPPRDETVQIGCYLTPASGGVWGMASAVPPHTRVAFVNFGNDSRINTSGTITEVAFYVPSTLPADCEVWIHIWRQGERWELVGSSGNIRSLLDATNGVNRVVLPNPIRYVQIGDCTGGELRYTDGSWGAGFHEIATGKTYSEWTNRDYAWAYGPRIESGADWAAATQRDGYTIPIVCYGAPPVWVMLGDSRCAGYPGTRSLLNATQQYNKDADMAWRLERILGRPVRNVGVEGNDTSEMLARFTNDVISAKPAGLIILPGAYNDFYHLPSALTTAQYTNNIKTMVDSALTNNVRFVAVCSDYPFWDSFAAGGHGEYGVGYTCIQGVASDERCAATKAMLDLYPSDRVLWIDIRPDLGQERPDWGDPYWESGNKWDLKDLFFASEDDRVHMSEGGADQTARTVGRELRSWLRSFEPETYTGTIILPDAGDANATVAANFYPLTILPYATTLSANRTVTLPGAADGLVVGQRIRVERTGLGDYWIDVGGVVTMPVAVASTVELYWSGAAWVLSSVLNQSLLTKWEDLQVPGTTIKTGASAPTFGAFGASGGLQAYLFQPGTVDDQCYFTVQMPHAYKEGSNIRPHIHWTQTAATGAGTNVVWGLEWSWANVNAAFAASGTNYVTNSISGTNWFHQIAQLPEIDGTSQTLSSILNCRLFRAGSSATADDYDQDAAFLQFDLHYQRDSNGSSLEYVK